MGEITSTSLADLEVGVRTAAILELLEARTVADLLALDPATLDPYAAAEVQELLEEEGIRWGEPIDPPEYLPPEDARIPRLTLDIAEAEDTDDATIDRAGGLPFAPHADVPWPRDARTGRPLSLLFQLAGSAGGGAADLGDVTLLQIFGDPGANLRTAGATSLVIYREPCEVLLEPPADVPTLPRRSVAFRAGFDDARIEHEAFQDDDEATWELATDHAFASKVGGLPEAANLDLPVLGADDEPLGFVLQLVDIDDDVLLFVFANDDFGEAHLEVVRG